MDKGRGVGIVFAALAALATGAQAQLLGADEVLKRVERTPIAGMKEARSIPGQLLADIKTFRTAGPSMSPAQAAARWIELFERAEALPANVAQADFASFDHDVNNFVSVGSVVAALPAPEAWPALRDAIRARGKRSPDDVRTLSLQLLGDHLTGDRKASAATLAEIDRAIAKLPPNDREAQRQLVDQVRAQAAILYGSPEEIAATFVGSLASQSRRTFGDTPIPDLVGLVGASRATAILREALRKPVRFHVPEGDETRALARRIALQDVASLPVAQWGLVDSIEAIDLYEALMRRFAAAKDTVAQTPPEERFNYRKMEADVWYFLALVVKGGRQADAERALAVVTQERDLHVPKRAVEALQRAGYNEQLFTFLHGLLGRRPDLRAWDVYTRQGALTDRSADVLSLIGSLLQRSDLAPYVLGDLRFYRVNALLAADQVDTAIAEIRALLAAPPARGERTLQARADMAVRLAGLGRILGRPELSGEGMKFARGVLALPVDRERMYEQDRFLRSVLAELRRQGQLEAGQALALDVLRRAGEAPNEMEQYGLGASPEAKAALAELAGIYDEAKRPADVVALLDRSAKWGAQDVSGLMQEKDALGVPVAMLAARALADTGNPQAALAVARATIEAYPGYDPAYELVVRIDRDAESYLDQVYRRDKFQERPLIWKAVLLSRQGRWLEAESLIREAITIDPSDGEEGPNDRMRAYAVLADVLDARGTKSAAGTFRRAVSAIRISERSDELHRLGLYQRAFAGYREALGQFSDAYCIQSRLAVRLFEQGRRQEAFEHYQRAYELMPSSFGRVESHCFGCESVFQGVEQQKIAERVFGELLKKDPAKPQIHYLMGYLDRERGKHGDAMKRFSEAVRLDSEYLNAWKQLHEVAAHVYMPAAQRDAVRLRLLELDPAQRHARYEVDAVGDLPALWRAVATAAQLRRSAAGGSLYPLRASGAEMKEKISKLPEPMRAQIEQVQAMSQAPQDLRVPASPQQAMARHRLIRATGALLGVRELGYD